ARLRHQLVDRAMQPETAGGVGRHAVALGAEKAPERQVGGLRGEIPAGGVERAEGHDRHAGVAEEVERAPGAIEQGARGGGLGASGRLRGWTTTRSIFIGGPPGSWSGYSTAAHDLSERPPRAEPRRLPTVLPGPVGGARVRLDAHGVPVVAGPHAHRLAAAAGPP